MHTKYTAEQWRTVDIYLKTSKNYKSPFEDVDVFGFFTAPDGQEKKLLAFWDGDGTWVVRFAPTMTGTWKYKTAATDNNPDFIQEGTVECIPYSGNLAMYKHGFLKVSDTKDYLEHADQTPFFWLGDTHWTFVTEEKFDASNCPEYESQFKACVDHRVAQKFTVYQCNFRDGIGTGGFGRSIDLMQDTPEGFVPNLEEFKNNVDPKMKYLADCGLLIAVGYAWGYDMAKNSVRRYKSLAKYTAARYGAYPVAWTLAGELPGYGDGKEKNVRDWGIVARECEKWNAYNNLQSVHLACDRPFPDIYRNESWFDFAMSQAGHGDYDMGQSMYARFRDTYRGYPILESEGAYEGATSGEYTSRIIPAAMMRRLAYLIMQSGGCGYTYGCNGVWELQWEAGVGGIGWGDMAWWDGLKLPGANQLTIFRDFYESVGWHRLKPLSFEQAGAKPLFMEATNRTQIFFTADAQMTTIVGYFSETSFPGFYVCGLTATAYKMWWMDPENGKRISEPKLLYPQNGVIDCTPVSHFGKRKDRLMVLEAAADK